jgi:hypothetical protein
VSAPETAPPPPEDSFRSDETTRRTGIVLTRCQQCSMRVRQDEMAVHLAHAHNIGPSTGGKDKGKRNRRDRER